MARWLELTRVVLPSLAAGRQWPIRADHCFMRVCLDTAVGQRWHDVCARPAIRHLPVPTLARAVAIAEALADGAAPLSDLNRRSIAMRRHAARMDGPSRGIGGRRDGSGGAGGA